MLHRGTFRVPEIVEELRLVVLRRRYTRSLNRFRGIGTRTRFRPQANSDRFVQLADDRFRIDGRQTISRYVEPSADPYASKLSSFLPLADKRLGINGR